MFSIKKHSLLVVSVIVFIWAITEACFNKKDATQDGNMNAWFNNRMDKLDAALDSLQSSTESGANLSVLQQRFHESRREYKHLESIIEYYFQGITKRINGPALPDVKTDDNQVWPPHGFQVIEGMLFGEFLDTTRPAIINEINILQSDLKFVKTQFQVQTILPRHLREAIQHELIRIATLGITGFDAPVSMNSIDEAAWALSGISEILGVVYDHSDPGISKSTSLINNAKVVLRGSSFELFDRLTFIREHLMPISESLSDFPIKASAEDSMFIRPFSGTLSMLMRGEGFNADAYASVDAAKSNVSKVKLGEMLFNDVRLSSKNDMSCGTCHRKDRYFTDGLKLSSGNVHGAVKRNTPTLYYSGLQAALFYDLRSGTLEDQIDDVMRNTTEFNLKSEEAARRLMQDSVIRKLGKMSFSSDTINSYHVRNAIASYVRTLNPFSSAFDQYMKGKDAAMSSEARNGFNLFAGKAKCATCHFIPLFNGSVPPFYTKHESEVIGVPSSPVWAKAKIDTDSGRYRFNKLDPFLYAFKTTGIRNITETAPYMHNGVYNTLEEVVSFYQKGGGVGIGIDLGHQTLPFDHLMLNASEKKALITFMESLTD